MKILYFLDFPFFEGGSSKVLLKQANIMQQRGCDVLVVLPNDENECHSEFYDIICKQYALKYITARYTIALQMYEVNILDVMRDFDSVKEIIKDFSPDMVHSTQVNVTVELAARSLKVPHLMNVYQAEKDSFDIDWLDVYPHYHSADSLLFSERWKTGLNISSKCIRVAYNPISNSKKQSFLKKEVHILSIGVLVEGKNQMETIRLVQHCKEDNIDVKLTFLGSYATDYGERCRKYTYENKLEDYVTFVGFVNNVEEYLADADLMIVASTVESYPGVIVESMANRVPVLSTPVAGVPELLIDENNGFLTRGYKEEDLYSTFCRYLSFRETGKINRIIERAYQTFETNHSYKVIGEEIEAYYQWIINTEKTAHVNRIGRDDIFRLFNKYFLDDIGYTKEVRRYVWYFYHIKQRIEQRKIVIWGAGQVGRDTLKCLEWLGCTDQVAGFVDTYKQGGYMGYPILKRVDEVISLECIILIAVSDYKAKMEIRKQLEQYDMQKDQDFYYVHNSIVDIS